MVNYDFLEMTYLYILENIQQVLITHLTLTPHPFYREDLIQSKLRFQIAVHVVQENCQYLALELAHISLLSF